MATGDQDYYQYHGGTTAEQYKDWSWTSIKYSEIISQDQNYIDHECPGCGSWVTSHKCKYCGR